MTHCVLLIVSVVALLHIISVTSSPAKRATITRLSNGSISYEMLNNCTGRNNTLVVPDDMFEGNVFLGAYTNNMNCSIRLIYSNRRSVFTFKFTRLNTEAGNDYVVVTGLTNSSQIRLTTALPQIPLEHETASNELLVHFHSDSSVLGTGFALNFQIVLKGGPLRCHFCSGVEHIRYCDVVVQCKTNKQICYVGQQFSTTEQILFDAGCVDHKFQYCKSGPQPNSCGECCGTDFCNNKGCGEALPSREHRGPICFDCQHLENPDHCNKISMCSSTEACYIQERKWGDTDQYYNMGCVDKSACPLSKRSVDSSVSNRSTFNCFNCCDGDHCNRNCSGTYVEPIIG